MTEGSPIRLNREGLPELLPPGQLLVIEQGIKANPHTQSYLTRDISRVYTVIVGGQQIPDKKQSDELGGYPTDTITTVLSKNEFTDLHTSSFAVLDHKPDQSYLVANVNGEVKRYIDWKWRRKRLEKKGFTFVPKGSKSIPSSTIILPRDYIS